mmetsp:Transcript_17572/g.30266  ORF Transcript_17572/g.30266 Transcript_17572/m.30266 type:complete len:95 (+) Transcript_17572:896-1180(+)
MVISFCEKIFKFVISYYGLMGVAQWIVMFFCTYEVIAKGSDASVGRFPLLLRIKLWIKSRFYAFPCWCEQGGIAIIAISIEAVEVSHSIAIAIG